MITKRQAELLGFIDQYISDEGFCPSYDEMLVALNLKSKSSVHRMVIALQSRGFISRHPHRSRAITILRRPNDGHNPHEDRALEALQQAQENDDYEVAHGDADDALCEFLIHMGYSRLVDEFTKVGKWYA